MENTTDHLLAKLNLGLKFCFNEIRCCIWFHAHRILPITKKVKTFFSFLECNSLKTSACEVKEKLRAWGFPYFLFPQWWGAHCPLPTALTGESEITNYFLPKNSQITSNPVTHTWFENGALPSSLATSATNKWKAKLVQGSQNGNPFICQIGNNSIKDFISQPLSTLWELTYWPNVVLIVSLWYRKTNINETSATNIWPVESFVDCCKVDLVTRFYIHSYISQEPFLCYEKRVGALSYSWNTLWILDYSKQMNLFTWKPTSGGPKWFSFAKSARATTKCF